MASRANPMTVTIMIMLVLATIMFTIFFITASNSLTMTMEGSPEDSMRKQSYDRVVKEVNDLRSEAAQLESQIAVREKELDRLEIDLSRQGVAYHNNVQYAGALGEDLAFNDRTYKAHQSGALVTLHTVNAAKERLESTKTSIEARAGDVAAPLEDEIDARSREQQQVLARANDMDAEYRNDEEKLLVLKDEIEKKRADAEKAKRYDFGVRSTDINTKEDAIRNLLEIELQELKELTPDGRILETVPSSRTAIIDIGAKDTVFAGLLLDVFQYQKGRYLAKGRLEVVDVQDQVAVCRILSEIDGRKQPIAPGDYVGNPVFDTARKPVFVLGGEFKQYNTEDLANFIRASGGEVVPTLQPGVDFLVTGGFADKLRDVAREYQLKAMTEEQLLLYVQPSFSVK